MTAGDIYAVAGTGTPGFSGEGGPALSAQLDTPGDVAIDTAGDIYIADGGNDRIREVIAAANTSIVVTGTVTYQSGGEALPVPGAVIQACSTTTTACTATGITSGSDGNYSLTVPAADTYVVTAFPSPPTSALPSAQDRPTLCPFPPVD